MLDELSQLRDTKWTSDDGINRMIRRSLSIAHSEISQLMEQASAESQHVSRDHRSRGEGSNHIQESLFELPPDLRLSPEVLEATRTS